MTSATDRDEIEAAAPVWLDRRTPPVILTLVAITGVAALNMNIVLPALPALAAHYGASYGVVALSISAYLALTAVLQLLMGPLSDRFGRRPVILVSLAIFLAATVGCIFAPTVQSFLFFRLLQAAVASGIALSRAIVRDMVPADSAASQIGYVTMGMSLMPMIGPMIGGALVETMGWRAVFGVSLVMGAAVAVLAFADLGETNRHRSSSFGAQFRAYPELARSKRFWGYAFTAATASGAFFAFLGGGPWVATEVLGMSPTELGFYFGFIALGYMFGNFLSGRYARRVGHQRNDAARRGGRHLRNGRGADAARGRGRASRQLLRGDTLRRPRERAAAAERQRRPRLGAPAPRRKRLRVLAAR